MCAWEPVFSACVDASFSVECLSAWDTLKYTKKYKPKKKKERTKERKAAVRLFGGENEGFPLKACLLFQDALPGPDMEQRLRSASSVDELMTLIYPSYWATLKCTSKLSSAAASPRSRSSGQQRPPASAGEPGFSAVYFNLDVLKSTMWIWNLPPAVSVWVGGTLLETRLYPCFVRSGDPVAPKGKKMALNRKWMNLQTQSPNFFL